MKMGQGPCRTRAALLVKQSSPIRVIPNILNRESNFEEVKSEE